MTTDAPLPLHLVSRDGCAAWLARQPEAAARWLRAQGFDGAPGTAATFPGDGGGIGGAVLGIGDPLDPHSYAHAPSGLASGP